jgi:hypothetical protein
MRRTLLIWAIVVARAANAHADAVVEELSAGASLSASTTPSVSWIADRVAGVWEISPRWQVRVDLGATRAMAPTDEDEASTVFTTSASAEFAPDAHWTFSLLAGWSPASTTRSSATVLDDTLPGGWGEADAQLTARSAMMSVAASADYDTGGTSDHETSASITLGANHFQSIQAITSITDPDGEMLTLPEVGDHCDLHECSRALEAALRPKGMLLTQLAISAGVMHTIEGDGDLGLGATCYLYDKDPTQVGYFSLATLGRGNLGNGSGVAPLRYAVSPSIGNRWGSLSGTLGVTYGIYIQDLGYDLTTSLRVQYKLKLDGDKRLKLYGKLVGSWGADPDGNPTAALSTALGAQYSW